MLWIRYLTAQRRNCKLGLGGYLAKLCKVLVIVPPNLTPACSVKLALRPPCSAMSSSKLCPPVSLRNSSLLHHCKVGLDTKMVPFGGPSLLPCVRISHSVRHLCNLLGSVQALSRPEARNSSSCQRSPSWALQRPRPRAREILWTLPMQQKMSLQIAQRCVISFDAMARRLTSALHSQEAQHEAWHVQ